MKKSDAPKRRRARTRAEILHDRRYREVRRVFASGDMPMLLGRYLASCGCVDESDAEAPHDGEAESGRGTKKRGRDAERRLPNPAGFCRFLGLGRDAYARLSAEFPTEVARMRAVFEDEALNSALSATVLAFYLKSLCDADGDGDAGEGDLVVTFEHDVLADGR